MTRYDWPDTDERTGTEDDFARAYDPTRDPAHDQGEVAPGWRRPILLAGWGAMVAALLGLLIYGIYLLVQGPNPAPTTPTAPPATPQQSSAMPTTAPTSLTPDTSNFQAPRAWPHLPSRITLPPLPSEIPSVVTLPAGL
jgi:hypothetical protein